MRWMVLWVALVGCAPECPTVDAAYDAGCGDVYDLAYEAGQAEAEACIPVTAQPVPDAVEDLRCQDPGADMQAEYARGWQECWVDAWFTGYDDQGMVGCGGGQQ